MNRESRPYYPEPKFLDIESVFPQKIGEEEIQELSTLHNCGWLSPQELINYKLEDMTNDQ